MSFLYMFFLPPFESLPLILCKRDAEKHSRGTRKRRSPIERKKTPIQEAVREGAQSLASQDSTRLLLLLQNDAWSLSLSLSLSLSNTALMPRMLLLDTPLFSLLFFRPNPDVMRETSKRNLNAVMRASSTETACREVALKRNGQRVWDTRSSCTIFFVRGTLKEIPA
jgi:hypothetical protein